MATDARLSVGLASHPKTKKLIRRLGTDAAWRLVCLFLWCAANRSNGSLAGMSDEDIELTVDWAGEEGAFAATLREVGFLDGDEYFSSIHDWEEHNPWAAGSEARSEKARWAALCKQHGRPGAAKLMPDYASSIGVASNESTTNSQPLASGKPVAMPKRASSTLDAVPESATSTPLAESSSAPSPSPSPSPSPKDKTTLSTCADLVSETERKKPDKARDDVTGIFDYWREVMKSPRSVLDEKRRKAISGALKAGHSSDDLRRAIRGCSMTPHNMGKNDRGQKYNGIELILRSADQIDRFIANDGGTEGGDAQVLTQLRERHPGATIMPLDDGRFRVGSRFYGADGSPQVSL